MKTNTNIRKYRSHQHCKNEDSEDCILWSACDDCFYYEKKLTCPFCDREIPKEWLFKNGCILCQQKGVKNE